MRWLTTREFNFVCLYMRVKTELCDQNRRVCCLHGDGFCVVMVNWEHLKSSYSPILALLLLFLLLAFLFVFYTQR